MEAEGVQMGRWQREGDMELLSGGVWGGVGSVNQQGFDFVFPLSRALVVIYK